LMANVTEANLDEYGRFGKLRASVDFDQAKKYLDQREGKSLPAFRVNIEVEKLLRGFVLRDELPEDLEVAKQSPGGGDA